MTGLGDEPSIDQIFQAASRVYISGINASAVCGLEEAYRKIQECQKKADDQSAQNDATQSAQNNTPQSDLDGAKREFMKKVRRSRSCVDYELE